MPLGLVCGDEVEVRSEEEILATLDDNGALDGMPFMPEMLAYCGKRFRVWKRADKTCDTIERTGARRLHDAVHLEGLRCDGSGHGGCQARCLLFWKEAWLRPVRKTSPVFEMMNSGADSARRNRCDERRLIEATRNRGDAEKSEPHYRCQATELLRATSPLAWWDPRQYLRDVHSGNVPLTALAKAGAFRIFQKLLRIGGYRALIWSYDRLQAWRAGTPYPFRRGALEKSPRATLDLEPGELVRVKSYEEILQTLNRQNKNHGLSFDPEMVRYCGTICRVLARVDRIVDERTGKMLTMARDCLILDNVICCAEYSEKRLFCPRAIYPYWREIWLERLSDVSRKYVSAPASAQYVARSMVPPSGDHA